VAADIAGAAGHQHWDFAHRPVASERGPSIPAARRPMSAFHPFRSGARNVAAEVSLSGRNHVEGEESETNRASFRGSGCAFGLRDNASGARDANLP
jgi:hypothetical protein